MRKAGVRANGVAIHPNGKFAYVSNGGDGSVSVIDAARDAAGAEKKKGGRSRPFFSFVEPTYLMF
jgi:DNA-binding beta-propeller fold protein YncE